MYNLTRGHHHTPNPMTPYEMSDLASQMLFLIQISISFKPFESSYDLINRSKAQWWLCCFAYAFRYFSTAHIEQPEVLARQGPICIFCLLILPFNQKGTMTYKVALKNIVRTRNPHKWYIYAFGDITILTSQCFSDIYTLDHFDKINFLWIAYAGHSPLN